MTDEEKTAMLASQEEEINFLAATVAYIRDKKTANGEAVDIADIINDVCNANADTYDEYMTFWYCLTAWFEV